MNPFFSYNPFRIWFACACALCAHMSTFPDWSHPLPLRSSYIPTHWRRRGGGGGAIFASSDSERSKFTVCVILSLRVRERMGRRVSKSKSSSGQGNSPVIGTCLSDFLFYTSRFLRAVVQRRWSPSLHSDARSKVFSLQCGVVVDGGSFTCPPRQWERERRLRNVHKTSFLKRAKSRETRHFMLCSWTFYVQCMLLDFFAEKIYILRNHVW